MNNWERKGYESREVGAVKVLEYLKQNEERIMSHSATDEAVITYGDLILNLNYKAKKSDKK